LISLFLSCSLLASLSLRLLPSSVCCSSA